MTVREQLRALFDEVVRSLDPERAVPNVVALRSLGVARQRRFGLAVGKAALRMARGAGEVEDGVAIAPFDDGKPLPAGWRRFVSAHPLIDARSVAAFEIAARIVEDDATEDDILIALISGGASALIESPRGDISLVELRDVTARLMAAGAPIADMNCVRSALSSCKAGGLVLNCAAPVITLALSDVVDDNLAIIGSGPTCGPWLVPDESPPIEKPPAPEVLFPRAPTEDEPLEPPAVLAHAAMGPRFATAEGPFDIGQADATLRARANDVLAKYGVDVPASVHAVLDLPVASFIVRREDRARVLVPMKAFAALVTARLVDATFFEQPLVGDVDACVERLAAHPDTVIAWGEPTLVLPDDHGEGGRAQHLALALAKRLRGTSRCALVIGTDGIDGPAPATRATPAGAYVDGTTWDAIVAAGIDPEVALVRRDAGTALAAVDALIVTGPTGINHADLVVLGETETFAAR